MKTYYKGSVTASLIWVCVPVPSVSSYSTRQPIGPIFKGQEVSTLEDGADMLSRNVDTELPLYAASHPRRTQI
jgi:hypothetical protein